MAHIVHGIEASISQRQAEQASSLIASFNKSTILRKYALISVGVFGPPTSKFVFARLAQMVCSKDTRVYTGSDGISLCLVRCCSCYRHLVCSRGYKQAREGEDPKSLVEGVNRC